MVKYILTALMLISVAYGQHIAYRQSVKSWGVSMSVPLNTQTKGSLYCIISKESDQSVTMVNYVESFKLWKFDIYGGAGVHFGNRQVLSYKRDANSIFLAGAMAIGGIKYTYNNIFISADITPRVDFPFFGGCEMHKHCGEAKPGSINLSIGLNLKK